MFGHAIDQSIPRLNDMPLLASYVRRHEHEKPLAGIAGLLIQHQLGNQVPMAEALISLGMEPDTNGHSGWLI